MIPDKKSLAFRKATSLSNFEALEGGIQIIRPNFFMFGFLIF